MLRTLPLPAMLAVALASTGAALAQDTPPDVRDLVGARAAGGETQLLARGYVNTGVQTGDDRKWTTWWNERSGVCLTVATAEGRYASIVASPAPDCRQDAHRRFTGPPLRRDDDDGEHIALVCYGEGEKLTSEYQTRYEWDSDKRRYRPRSGVELTTKDYDTSVTIRIDGDDGQIRPARNMVPPLHADSNDGWYEISGLAITRDTIRGQFKFNGANRPKITIDRRSGHIVLDGLTKFRGTCDPMDGDRRF